MTPQERETAAWKRRLAITEQKGTWTAGETGPRQQITFCAMGRGKPKQCHKTRAAAIQHLHSLVASGKSTGTKSTYRCDWCSTYHVGRR